MGGVRRRGWRGVAGVALGLLVSAPVAAQQMNWTASVRPRAETWEVDEADSRMFTSMQTRLGLARSLSSDARIFVQLQDVRLWGEELSTADASADRFDLHQGYLELGHRGSSLLWLRAGRQEMEFAEGRLVGAPAWTQAGQAFDGVRGALTLGDRTVLDLFGMQIRESEAGTLLSDAAFFGAWSETDLGGGRFLQLFLLHDQDEAGATTSRTTLGTYYAATSGIVEYRVEGAWQTGEASGDDVSAHMLGARVGAPVFQGKGNVTLWYDRYSGDATPEAGETGAFSDLFGRNHRFFGYADLFGDIPGDTQGRGLQDVALKLGFTVFDEGRLGIDLHRFLATDDEGLEGATLADEVDLTFSYPVAGGVDLLAGGAWVSLADDGLALGLAPGNVLFGFLQLSASF